MTREPGSSFWPQVCTVTGLLALGKPLPFLDLDFPNQNRGAWIMLAVSSCFSFIVETCLLFNINPDAGEL